MCPTPGPRLGLARPWLPERLGCSRTRWPTKYSTTSSWTRPGKSPSRIWQRWEPAPGGQRDADRDTPESLVRFLITAHRADGIHALASRFHNLPVETRVLILEAFARACDGAQWRSAVQPPWAPGEQPSLRAATSAAEDFLFQALDDTTVNPNMTFGCGDQPSWQARACDHAAIALLSLRTGRWSGPGEATLAARDARVAALKAGGRQER